ncbi:MAG TPA: hypothetical protein VJ961_02100 [Mariprofundaceae bacterium]|nr:hypothetical protein [Mariprofundaceae bacterium]
MSLGDLYRRRYRRARRRRILGILSLLMLVAIMLVAVRSCSDHINRDMQNYQPFPFNEKIKKFIEKHLNETGHDQRNRQEPLP